MAFQRQNPLAGSQQDLEQPASASEPTGTLHQSLSSLAASIRRLYGKDSANGQT